MIDAKLVLTGPYAGTIFVEQGGTVRIFKSKKFHHGSTLLRNVFAEDRLEDVRVEGFHHGED